MRSKVLYKDKDIIVIDKPANIPVETRNIAVTDCESEIRNEYRVSTVSAITRLDQPVSGIVLFALNKEAAKTLSKDLTEGKMVKTYKAKVFGELPKESDTLTDYIYKDGRTNLSKTVKEGDANFGEAKKAILRYTKKDGFVIIDLLTGRHHQIRVQLASMGHPILGDLKYGTDESKAEAKALGINRLCLTAYSLEFTHPRTGERMIFTSEIDV